MGEKTNCFRYNVYILSIVLFYTAKKIAMDAMNMQKGEKVVITGGVTNGQSGNTNLIKIEDI